jgi:pSer/pThr/pTyr-binding forkhead associated (FHA) protein
MPPSPLPPPPPSDEERPGTVLETDEEIRKSLKPAKPAPRAAPAPAPPAPPAPPQSASPGPSASKYSPTARPPIAILTVFDDGKSEGEVIRIRTDRFVIGRSEGDLRIAHDELISARHVEITRLRVGEAYRWVITDLQTTNGLFVRVSRTVLAAKAEFLVGKGCYRFEAPTGVAPNTVDFLPPDTPLASTRPWEAHSPTSEQPMLVEMVSGTTGARLPLTKAEYWIGSDPDCAIYRTGDPFVEARHVRLYRDPSGAWHAQNNKSANGLWYRVPQIVVDDACLFQIGEQRLRLKAGG